VAIQSLQIPEIIFGNSPEFIEAAESTMEEIFQN
jgi:hypothetical protein